MSFQSDLKKIITNRKTSPYFFIGSGLSRRYINLENWEGLLKRFSDEMGTIYQFYKTKTDNDLPTIARLISDDYHDYWWKTKATDENVFKNFATKSDPLRWEISQHLNHITPNDLIADEYKAEIALLKNTDVDGIITTNWDTFLETIFEEYTVYIGQEELLFSNPLNIAEIYKIHGCRTKPESLILTDNDYKNYNEKNAYLASKLITIFVEHPIIFIGYSITDPNIQAILKSISMCIGVQNLDKLKDNLLFLNHQETDGMPSINNSSLTIQDITLPITEIKSQDFKPIYQAIIDIDRKLSAKVLRFCKEQIYEIVQSSAPEKKLGVMNYDDIKKSKNIEVVVGIGVMKEITGYGYQGLTMDDLLEDVVLNNKSLNAQKLLETTILKFSQSYKNVPIYKYIRQCGIDDNQKLSTLNENIKRFKHSVINAQMKPIEAAYENMSFQEFLEIAPLNKVATNAIRFPDYSVDTMKTYLSLKLSDKNVQRNELRTLIKDYDFMKYGF